METPESLNVRGILPPVYGWQNSSYYVVDVAYSKSNVIHRAIMYRDFDTFIFFNGTYEYAERRKVYYMKYVEEIKSMVK